MKTFLILIKCIVSVQDPATSGNLPKRHDPQPSKNQRRCNCFLAPHPPKKSQNTCETAQEMTRWQGDLAGRVVLINFWATWCPPCRAELPEIAEIGYKFADDADVLLLPVSCGEEDLLQLSTNSILFLREKDLHMPCYADPNGVTRQAFASVAGTNQLSLPTTLILDRKGVIRGVWIGFRSGQGKEMQEMISKLLASE